MDFFKVAYRAARRGVTEVYPNFIIGDSKDLMVRGRDFYAVWDEAKGLWSRNEFDIVRIIDNELYAYADKLRQESSDGVMVLSMSDFGSRTWTNYKTFLSRFPDNYKDLDATLTFANSEVTKADYVSKRLPYSLADGDYSAWDQLVGTLYSSHERRKIEWAIGAIVAGDAKEIQKFLVFYGDAGTGKSTILNIIQKLFDGYYAIFDARSLASASSQFSTEAFKSNPLVAIQHDGDLSRIEDNSKLNSIVAHEEMTINEKHKSLYSIKMNAFLFMATNKPVKITDAKSGLIRRLIDVNPSGEKLPSDQYQFLMDQIDFELGAIASHCLAVYNSLGKHYYDAYRSSEMQYKTDVFFNFVDENYFEFMQEDGITLKQAYAMYKDYCQETALSYMMPMYSFREELKNYFRRFDKQITIDGKHYRSYYSGFLASKLEETVSEYVDEPKKPKQWLTLECEESLFDIQGESWPAQYAVDSGIPSVKWIHCDTFLRDIDTKKLHYVKVPSNHIVIDFDIKDKNGEKSKKLNIEAANKWPKTYAEYSKSGAGLHLHYIYDGDVSTLSRIYSEGIEIKVFSGNSSLRRQLTLCNDIPIAHISGGLPLKEKKVINISSVKSEKSIRDLIIRNLNKSIHPATKPSVDFIFTILEEAYASGLKYDVSDMYTTVLDFAASSTHNAPYCIELVGKMHFASDEQEESSEAYVSDELVFFDIEVFPNLFLVNYKPEGEGKPVIRMINPSQKDIEELFSYKLVGFNNRRYDNHILYARYIGRSIEELYYISQGIINGNRDCFFGEAYKVSYADVYDFSSKKQSLKKFEIELGIHHQELGLPWDQPVPEERWVEVAEYCDNDVIATEAVFNARKQDFVARKILADLSGLTVNDSTQQHAARIIFGNDPNPQDKFVYTDLSKMFPGYKYESGVSTYRGEVIGEGGYVYVEEGMYLEEVESEDAASMHPTSIEELNLFGPYTKNFSQLKQARIAIKHHDYDIVREMLDGKLSKYLTENEEDADALAYALKIIINIVYGLTAAKFPNKFRDPRNVDNIVAKRGALFMVDLKHAVQEKGFRVVHIKTDSIKIASPTQEIIDFVREFAKGYGYSFETEAIYDRFCIVNKAVYVARYGAGRNKGKWTATGAQFQQPYVFKTLFSKEPITFDDMCETKNTKTAFYLDMDEDLPENEHKYVFVGKAGQFCPVKDGVGGGRLCREQAEKYYAATDSNGYRWLESEVVRKLVNDEDKLDVIDIKYYKKKVDEAVSEISKYGDFEAFVS